MAIPANAIGRDKYASFFGAIFVVLGFCCTGLLVKCLYESDTSRWYIAAAIGAFLFAFVLTLHGMFLAFFGHYDKLAAFHRRSENIGVLPVIIPELKLRNIQPKQLKKSKLGRDFELIFRSNPLWSSFFRC